MTKRHFAGALLLAALPLPCQPPQNGKLQQLLRFTLNENRQQIQALLGSPNRIDDSVAGYQSWQYEFPPDEKSDDNSPPAWFICVSTDKGQVLSVTRNFDEPQDVDGLFPASQTATHHWPSKDAARFSVRLRPLSNDVLLLAMGTSKPGEKTAQLILIRRTAVRTFMPWLAEQLQ